MYYVCLCVSLWVCMSGISESFVFVLRQYVLMHVVC